MKIKMFIKRKYSGDDNCGCGRSFKVKVDSQAQASLPPSRSQATAQADKDEKRKVIDIKNLNLNEQGRKNLKGHDAFLYYSIFTAAQDAKMHSNSKEELQIQTPLQDGSQSQSSNDSNPTAAATTTTTSTMIERKSRISCECHPDLLLDSLLDDGSDHSVEEKDEDSVVDPILKLMYCLHDDE